MNQLNSLILEGNLTKDAVFTEPTAGFKVCKFSLAVNRYFKNKNNDGVEEVSFFDVEVYGKYAEGCEKNAKKGRGVRVVGRLKQSTWKDANGKMQSRVYVIAEHLEFKPVYSKTGETEKVYAKDKVAENVTAKDVETVKEPEPVKEVVAF